jgi:hypothetical protein
MPLCRPIEAFTAEPFYHLLRYQLMARQVEVRKAGVIDPASVLYVYIPENRGLRRVIVHAFRNLGKDVFSVWIRMLIHTETFISISLAKLLEKLTEVSPLQLSAWLGYLRERYPVE